jgi:hypothetical protein
LQVPVFFKRQVFTKVALPLKVVPSGMDTSVMNCAASQDVVGAAAGTDVAVAALAGGAGCVLIISGTGVLGGAAIVAVAGLVGTNSAF